MKSLVAIASATVVASALLTRVLCDLAVRYDIVDKPNRRSSHHVPTPRGGGVAVLLGSIVGMAVGVSVALVHLVDAMILGGGMLALGIVGWADDRRHVSLPVRLAVHVVVAGTTIYLLGGLPEIRVGEASVRLGAWGYAIGTIGVVWSINLFNFMDGIDGLAGSQAALIFATLAALLFANGDSSFGTLAVIFSAASAGFLMWNWPPARIFLGDAGSGALGYLIAAFAVGGETRGSLPLLSVAIAGGFFISDATVTLLRRLRRGQKVTEAHRDHAYQRLARALSSHRSVTLGGMALTCMLGAVAFTSAHFPSVLLPSVAIAAVLLGVVLGVVETRAPM